MFEWRPLDTLIPFWWYTYILETIQDFLIKLDIKPLMHLLEISLILSALFTILVSLTMTWFSENMLIFTRSMHGFMSNLIKKSWKDSMGEDLARENERLKQKSIVSSMVRMMPPHPTAPPPPCAPRRALFLPSPSSRLPSLPLQRFLQL